MANPDEHPTATCTISFQDYKTYRCRTDCEYPIESNFQVNFNFYNYHEEHQKNNCPCFSSHEAIPRKIINDDLESYSSYIRFLLNSESSILTVLCAESIPGLPGYVTPGVWADVKNYVWSQIKKLHVNLDDGYDFFFMYEMTFMVDVSTIDLDDEACSCVENAVAPVLPDDHHLGGHAHIKGIDLEEILAGDHPNGWAELCRDFFMRKLLVSSYF